jgi:hypothetical protein
MDVRGLPLTYEFLNSIPNRVNCEDLSMTIFRESGFSRDGQVSLNISETPGDAIAAIS